MRGTTWERVDDRVLEVEHWVHHDGRMNTWALLRAGAALLAEVHDAWVDLQLGAEGEACDWANWIAPAAGGADLGEATRRLHRWGLGELAGDVQRLTELTAGDLELPRQIVHGDFWDDNVYVRAGHLVAVTDFDFLGRRPRVDDLALMLYFADEEPYFHGVTYRSAATRRAELTPLVAAYARHLTNPLTSSELAALPVALARQPLWTFGRRLLDDPDHDHARRDAVDTAPAVTRALEIVERPDAWLTAFARASDR